MKTLGPFKDRRLADAVRQHRMAPGRIAQIGILLDQCFHARNMPEKPMD